MPAQTPQEGQDGEGGLDGKETRRTAERLYTGPLGAFYGYSRRSPTALNGGYDRVGDEIAWTAQNTSGRATAGQQNRNVLELLTACCRARLEGSAAPSLLPAAAELAAA